MPTTKQLVLAEQIRTRRDVWGTWSVEYVQADGTWYVDPLGFSRAQTSLRCATRLWRAEHRRELVISKTACIGYDVGYAVGSAWCWARHRVRYAVAVLLATATVYAYVRVIQATPPLSGGTLLAGAIAICGVGLVGVVLRAWDDD